MGDTERALEDLDQALALAPQEKWAHLLKALVYWSRGREGDLAAARDALAGYPDQRSVYPAFFWITQELLEGDAEAALTRVSNLAQPVLVLQTHFLPRDLMAGIAASRLGDAERARTAFASAARLLESEAEERPDDHRVRSALALAYAGLGRREEAIREGRAAVEMNPISRDALMGADRVWDLARVYVMVDEPDLALDQLALLFSMPSRYTPALVRLDPAFAPLRGHPRLAALVRQHASAADSGPGG